MDTDVKHFDELMNIADIIQEEIPTALEQLNSTGLTMDYLSKRIKEQKDTLKFHYKYYKSAYLELVILCKLKRELEANMR